MSRRRLAGTALAAALVLAAGAGCATTEQMNATPQASASTHTASASTKAAEENAVTRLRAWLAAPQAGTLTYNTVQVTSDGSADSSTNAMSILSGTFDPNLGQAALTGSMQTLGAGDAKQTKSSAIETEGQVYTTLPATSSTASPSPTQTQTASPTQPQNPTQTADALGKTWEVAGVHTTWAKDAERSGWWTALDSVRSVTADGVTSINGTTVDVYSATVDLAKVKGIPKALLESDPVKKAGTTKIEVDVYTAMGSGLLVRVTYKLGLPVQIDATAAADSSAGYQVDMSGFAQPGATASPTPTAQPTAPDASTVDTDTAGDGDLAALLPF